MTPEEEYYKCHVPHRVNLLITFRERYSKSNLKPDDIRDLFRCSKDISMLMVRFFLGELGINFKKEKDNPTNDISTLWKPKYGIKQLTENEVRADPRFSNIKEVLKAANRAVAHFDSNHVNHPIKLDTDHHILFDAIDFTEEKIIEKMYVPNHYDYKAIMALPDNNMQRKPLTV